MSIFQLSSFFPSYNLKQLPTSLFRFAKIKANQKILLPEKQLKRIKTTTILDHTNHPRNNAMPLYVYSLECF